MRLLSTVLSATGLLGAAIFTPASVSQAARAVDGPAAISCATVTSCVAVGLGDGSEIWNGRTWVTQPTVRLDGAGPKVLYGVSCVTARWCLAVGAAGGQPLVERWDGQWSRLPAPSLGGATLLAVSCVSIAHCVAAGSAGRAVSAIWNGTSWTAAAVPGPATAVVSELAGVSCTARSFCMAVGDSQRKTGGLQTQLAESWNGSRWTPQALPDAGLASALTSVSCTASAACTAVGKFSPRHAASARPFRPDKGLAERWNGKRWARQSMPALKVLMGGGTEMTGDNPLLTGVSCSGATQCLAVGSDHCCAAGGVWGAIGAHWNGRQWTAARPFIPADHWFTAMNGVSCAAASRCEAVGVSARAVQYDASTLAERWNGTVWTQQAVP